MRPLWAWVETVGHRGGYICLAVFWILLHSNCVLFQKNVKIKPIAFNYQAIGQNYFTPKNDKPFPLTIQRGNNLYNSTTHDGRYLFYATNKEGNFDIWFRDLQSSVVVPVTEHPSQEYKPAISPDGTKLVFVSEQYDSEGDLVLLEINPKQWVDGALKGERFLNQRFQVLTNPDYKNPNRQNKVVDTDPTWLPDGKRIVYSTDRFSPGTQNLVLLDLSDKNRQIQLTHDGGSSPYVSFDGQYIYYLSFRDSVKGEIYRLHLSSRSIERMTNDGYLDFSPSVSKDNRYLYYTSIRKDTNGNQVLDERDYSYIVQKDLNTGREKFLSSGDNSVFDTKYSTFNGGSVLFSAAFYNSINVYFIPSNGSIPKQETINEQFKYALEYESGSNQSSNPVSIQASNQARYFLALDSVELFYDSDPLFPIYRARRDAKKAEYLFKNNQRTQAFALLKEMDARREIADALSVAFAVYLDPGRKDRTEIEINRSLEIIRVLPNRDNQTLELEAALLDLLAKWQEDQGKIRDMIATLARIQEKYPDYHLIREVKNKHGVYEFQPHSSTIPKFYRDNLVSYDALVRSNSEISIARRIELKDLLLDLDKKIRQGKNPDEMLAHIEAIRSDPSYPQNSVLLSHYLVYLQADALRMARRSDESSQVLDAVIPIPANLEMDPPGQKSIFEYPELIQTYRNPALSFIHLLRYKNAQAQGNVSFALRNLRIFMEFFDPILSPELTEDEFAKLFMLWESKAIEFERIGDLQQAAFHYYYNNLGMSLAKSKNIPVDKFYGSYAVYYQRKMIDTIFRHGKDLRSKEEAAFLSKVNILKEGKLDVLGNLSDLMALVQSMPFLDALKILGDFRDLRNKDAIHENALLLSDQYFKYHLEKNRPFLNLAVVYGHAYYLINRAVINESAHYANKSMTENRKRNTLENFKKAEYELRWILFADPTFPDAYQLLGWLYQYIDIIKSKRVEADGPTEEERYEGIYKMYFPEKNFEENVELYTQILEFLGKEYKNKKVLSDLNLNLGNNYFLLSNYPKANESSGQVENYGQYVVSRAQFEDYRQEAVFRFNYGRSALYRSDYRKAIEQFQMALDIYTKNEYYQSLMSPELKEDGSLAHSKEFQSVKSKLAILNAMIGLCRMEMGEFEEAIAPIQSAISHNRVGKDLDSLNLWNALAVAYQKTGRFRESKEILATADLEYQKAKDAESWWRFSLSRSFWGVVLPDKVRVMGEGRFPGEFPLDFKNLLSRSILVNNYLDERDYARALQEIDHREEFIQKKKLRKWEMGTIVNRQSDALRGQIYFDSQDYPRAYEAYDQMFQGFRESGLVLRERIALKRRAYSAFAQAETFTSPDDTRRLLLKNQESLLNYRREKIRECSEEMDAHICQERFRKEFKDYDILQGLNAFYLGEWEKHNGALEKSFDYYGRALFFLKNPGNVEERFHMLPQDPFSKRERIRNTLNLARLYLRLGDVSSATSLIKEAREFSFEFRLEREMFHTELVQYELESMQAYKSNTAQARQAERTLSLNRKRYDSEEYIKRQLPQHTRREWGIVQNRHSLWTGQVWEIPLQRDALREEILSNQVIKSSLEYSDLRLDFAVRNLQRELGRLEKIQSDIEERSMRREKLGNLLQTKQEAIEMVGIFRSALEEEFPRYSRFYGKAKAQIPVPPPDGSLVVRCLDTEGSRLIWTIRKNQKEYSMVPKSQSLEFLGSKMRSDSYHRILLNPDNCLDLYRDWSSYTQAPVSYITNEAGYNPEKFREGIGWRWRTVLSAQKRTNEKLRLKSTDAEILGAKVLDTDALFVTNSRLDAKFPYFTYLGRGSLNIRELFTGNSEIAAVVLESDGFTEKDWVRASYLWEFLAAPKDKVLFLSRTLNDNEREKVTREDLSKRSVVFGIPPQKMLADNPLGKYRELRVAGNFQERSRNYTNAYDLYYDAGAFLGEEDPELVLENEIDIVRMKRRIFPSEKISNFYRPLLDQYSHNPDYSDRIYSNLLRDCFADRSLKTKRNECEIFYKEWVNVRPQSAQSVAFHYKMFKGELSGYQDLLNQATGYREEDEFTKNMAISDLFLENFLFEESEKFAREAAKQTLSPRERGIINARKLEINYHRAYLEGATEFAYKPIAATTTYAMGFNRDWTTYRNRVYSETFRKLGDSDSIYDTYRKRLYQKWMDWEFGLEFEPGALIPDELYEGGSVLSKMTHLNRSLYFYLISESSRHQIYSEADALVDTLISEEMEEGFRNRALTYNLLYADQLLRNGDLPRAQKYLDRFEKTYDPQMNNHPYLHRKHVFLKYKLSLFLSKPIPWDESQLSVLSSHEKEWIDIYSDTKRSGPEQFDRVLNQCIGSKKNAGQPFTKEKRRNLEDVIQYMKKVSFDADSTAGYLDAIHFQQHLSAYSERTLGYKPSFSDIPRFSGIAKQLIAVLPAGQEIHAISDYLNKTYLITLAEGKSKGRELFADTRLTRKNIRNYYRSAEDGGEESRLRDVIEDRYRTSLRLPKDKINYLYMAGYHFYAPLIQKSDTTVYQVQNLGALARSRPVPSGVITWKQSQGKRYKETKFAPGWYETLKSIENWELTKMSVGTGTSVHLSQEEAMVNPAGILVFGETPVARLERSKSKRNSPWMVSSNLLGYPYFLSSATSDLFFHLDSIHNGAGVVSLEEQGDFHNAYFIRKFVAPRDIAVPIRFRFMDARDEMRNRYPFDKYWHGYRLYTNSLILP